MTEAKSERLIFSASPKFISRIDAFRANHPKLPSRSQAIRVLINVGLLVAEHREAFELLSEASESARAIMEEAAQNKE